MKSFKLILLATFLSVVVLSCDEISEDNQTQKGPNGCAVLQPTFTPRLNPERKVLLEEFTGHRCGYCPNGAITINNLIANYNEQLIAIAHHSGDPIFSGFTEPFPADSGYFNYDFRCNESTTIGNYFGVSGLPTGLVNRTDFGTGVPIVYSSWPGKVSQLLANPPQMDLQLKSFWSAADSNLCVYYSVDVLENLSGNFKLAMYITEDSIIQWQKDYSMVPNNIQFYVHNHVMRKSINGVNGTILTPKTELSAGENFIDGYSTKLNLQILNPEHLHIVAFVYNADNDEVIQAEEIKITP